MSPDTARAALDTYIAATNSHDFSDVERVLVESPTYFFTDATLTTRDAVRAYFERTWEAIPDEVYAAEDVEWVIEEADAATAVYTFRWRGTLNGQMRSGHGRATNAFVRTRDGWRLAHEHLSSAPSDTVVA